MKRFILLLMALLMMLQLGNAWAEGQATPELSQTSEEQELDSVDLALKDYLDGSPTVIWQGKLVGERGKVDFQYVLPGDSRFTSGQLYFIRNLSKIVTDGKINVKAGKKPDFLFASETGAESGSGETLKVNFECYAAFYLEKIVPYCYFMLAPHGDEKMDFQYQRVLSGGGEALIAPDLLGPANAFKFDRLLNSMVWTMSWERDAVLWFEDKDQERTRLDREWITKILLNTTEEQQRVFINTCVAIYSKTVRVDDKDYITIAKVKDKKLLQHVSTPPQIGGQSTN